MACDACEQPPVARRDRVPQRDARRVGEAARRAGRRPDRRAAGHQVAPQAAEAPELAQHAARLRAGRCMVETGHGDGDLGGDVAAVAAEAEPTPCRARAPAAGSPPRGRARRAPDRRSREPPRRRVRGRRRRRARPGRERDLGLDHAGLRGAARIAGRAVAAPCRAHVPARGRVVEALARRQRGDDLELGPLPAVEPPLATELLGALQDLERRAAAQERLEPVEVEPAVLDPELVHLGRGLLVELERDDHVAEQRARVCAVRREQPAGQRRACRHQALGVVEVGERALRLALEHLDDGRVDPRTAGVMQLAVVLELPRRPPEEPQRGREAPGAGLDVRELRERERPPPAGISRSARAPAERPRLGAGERQRRRVGRTGRPDEGGVADRYGLAQRALRRAAPARDSPSRSSASARWWRQTARLRGSPRPLRSRRRARRRPAPDRG